jgi:hypothetical protein
MRYNGLRLGEGGELRASIFSTKIKITAKEKCEFCTFFAIS